MECAPEFRSGPGVGPDIIDPDSGRRKAGVLGFGAAQGLLTRLSHERYCLHPSIDLEI